MSAKIESYALIGNCQTAALVGLDGSIDWLCLPDFSSDACFAAILGTPDNGRWLITASDSAKSHRQYRGDTTILETTFTTPTGSALLIDFIARPAEDTPARIELIRIVRPLHGSVKMRMEFTLRFDYGKVIPWVQRADGGIRATAGPDSVILRSPVPMKGENDRHTSEFEVRSGGQDVTFVLSYFASYRPLPPMPDPKHLERETDKFWTGWSKQFNSKNKWRDAVMRSLITLKSLVYQPTGGIVAAPTTSLPESTGGKRNWDYRYCWIRDSTLTLFALVHCGYHEEAHAWRHWMLRAAAGDPGDLQIMYGIFGQRRLDEREIEWLSGYENSRPVRIGNQAHGQFQLDVFGELIGTLYLARHLHGRTDGAVDSWNLQRALMRYLELNWNKPDKGIWEVRGPSRQFTHSKAMAWLAVDRSIKDAEKFKFEAPLDRWRALRDKIHAEVCNLGFNKQKNTFTQYFGSDTVDAALLLIPRIGFLPPDDPRFLGTIKAVESELLVENTFVRRYKTDNNVDGVGGDEAAFLPCAFWLAEAYALTGRRDEAVSLFERLLKVRNDVGLLSEEYDFKQRRLLGNFPQAFTHVALISTAALIAGETQWLPIE